MYMPWSLACDQPNSETPMTQAAIDAQDAYIAAVGNRFNRGNAALGNLIARGGGSASTVYGAAGQPVDSGADPASAFLLGTAARPYPCGAVPPQLSPVLVAGGPPAPRAAAAGSAPLGTGAGAGFALILLLAVVGAAVAPK